MLFYDGSKLLRGRLEDDRARRTGSTNTLGRKVSNARMIAIAASLRRLKQ